jgi:D-lactate dehydrogenase (cytochrome)
MKDWVVNLTVVLADGTVIKTRHRPRCVFTLARFDRELTINRKTSAGYNLTSLFTGSEGTLGMITEITLKLATIPENQSVAIVTFPTIREAAASASKVMRLGIQVAALEMMDETQMQVINKNGGAGGRLWAEKPTLIFKYIFRKTRPWITLSTKQVLGNSASYR